MAVCVRIDLYSGVLALAAQALGHARPIQPIQRHISALALAMEAMATHGLNSGALAALALGHAY